MDRNFHPRKLNPNTWLFDGDGSYSYLIMGESKALMVDTGMSKGNLRAYAEQFTDLPIIVVNTHGHFDHTGGNGYFDEVYVHPAGLTMCKQAFGDASDFPLDYEPKPVEEGFVFDLGGTLVEVLSIPAHDASSIALIDHTNRVLYTGDEVEGGQVLLGGFGPAEGPNRVRAHLGNMLKLKARENEYDLIFPGHNGTPIDKSYIDMFIAVDEKVLAGTPGSCDMFSRVLPDYLCERFTVQAEKGVARRAEYIAASIIYDPNNAAKKE